MSTLFNAASMALLALAANNVETEADTSTTSTEAASPALSEPEALSLQADNEIIWTWKDGLRFQTNDGRFKFRFGGRIQNDWSWISGDDDFDAAGFDTSDGSEMRRSRLFISGDVYEDIFFKAQYDFAGGDADFNDVYIGKRDIFGGADLKIGHFKEPFSLEQLTSSKYLSFTERALPDVFSPGRNNGVGLNDTLLDDNLTWNVGVFRNSTDSAAISQEDGGYAVTARVTGTPVYEEEDGTLLHLGGAYSLRDNDSLRYAQRPEVHLTDPFLDTGTMASDDVDLGGLEIAGVMGPFHAQAEYMMADMDAASGASDADFDGFYAQAGFFITGETRPYKRSSGTFDRLRPEENFGNGGLGAFEVAVRYSTLDLEDGSVTGGEEDNIAIALNWFLNANLRVMADYVLADIERSDTVPVLDDDLDAFVVRFQLEW